MSSPVITFSTIILSDKTDFVSVSPVWLILKNFFFTSYNSNSLLVNWGSAIASLAISVDKYWEKMSYRDIGLVAQLQPKLPIVKTATCLKASIGHYQILIRPIKK